MVTKDLQTLNLKFDQVMFDNLVFMLDKMAFSAYILKIVGKDPLLRLQIRAKEDFVYCLEPIESLPLQQCVHSMSELWYPKW